MLEQYNVGTVLDNVAAMLQRCDAQEILIANHLV